MPDSSTTESAAVDREKTCSCPTCGQEGSTSGIDASDDAQAMIAELEGEVDMLNARAKDSGMSTTLPGWPFAGTVANRNSAETG